MFIAACCYGFRNSWADGRTELSLFLKMSDPFFLDSCSIALLVSKADWTQTEHESEDGA